jgi:signal transduction histidine kinase/CheY-like chemotaxis protein
MSSEKGKSGLILSSTCARIMVLICLITTAVIIGVGSYFILSKLQDKAQREQYYAITNKIESSTLSATIDKQDALNTGLTVALQYCPNESDWPQCAISFDFYQAILSPLSRVSQTRSITIAPVLQPSDVASFENFAYQFFEDNGHPEFGISPFGKGIFAINSTTGQRYHDTTGITGGGKYQMLMPVFQVTDFPHNQGVLMYNTYSQSSRVKAIDYSMDCIQQGGKSTGNCNSITDIIYLVQDQDVIRPSSLAIVPITAKNSSQVLGIISAVFQWDRVLNLAVNEKVDGIMAVLSDGSISHSFIYDGGQVTWETYGDVHDSKYNGQRVSFAVAPFEGPTQYTITLYPTEKWMNHYNDEVPLVASLVMVGLIAFTSLVFCIYDFVINREAVHKDLVMQTKRQYVRYISHEIRTPLNVVHLGFQVLYTEIKKMREHIKNRSDADFPNNKGMLIVDESTGSSGDAHESTSFSVQNGAPSNASSTYLLDQTEDTLDLVRDIVESLNSAISVLNDLIDYDKIESGTLNLQKEVMPFRNIVETTVSPFLVQARAKNINLKIETQSRKVESDQNISNLFILGDRVKLGQVFRNLVSNALKFTPPGGNVRVETKWAQNDFTGMTESVTRSLNRSLSAASDLSKRSPSWLPYFLWSVFKRKPSKVAAMHKDPLESQYESAGRVVITVTDSGAGMSEKQVKQLFREGVQFNPNDLQAGQGSGLGLWITKGIVDSHGGKLWAASEGEGQGTTFTFSLPIFKLLDPHADVSMSKMEENFPPNQKASKLQTFSAHLTQNSITGHTAEDLEEINPIELTIRTRPAHCFRNLLVTDDSAVNRKMMCRSLQSVGFKCFQAADGRECVDIVDKAMRNEHESIDLVLMDYEMPRMNGPTACAALRAMDCGIPVVGVTGNVLNEDKQLFMEHGAMRVLQKPFSISELEAVLNECEVWLSSVSKQLLFGNSKDDGHRHDNSTSLTPLPSSLRHPSKVNPTLN